MNDMIRFGVIGRNFVVDWMMSAIGACPDAAAAAILSRSAEGAGAFGEKYGIAPEKRYTDLAALAADPDIDAVYVASPNACHEPQALALLDAGKHVLCEKPAALSSAALRRLTQKAEEKGVVFMEAMPSVSMPGTQRIKELLPQIGKVRRASFSFCQYSSRYDKFKAGTVENAFDPKLGGGSMRDIGIYCAAMAAELFGRPDRLTAESVILENGMDGEGTILASYGGQMICELIYSKISDRPIPSIIEGEDGSITVNSMSRPKKLSLIRRAGAVPKNGDRPGFENGESVDLSDSAVPDMLYELEEFISACRVGALPAAAKERMCTEALFLDAVYGR